MKLINGNCLEELPKLPDKSVDFFFLDLPYGQTNLAFDKHMINLDDLWFQLKRLARHDRVPFFFTTTTKFGYDLIKSNPKWFRFDLVWEKPNAVGWLNAKRQPMRNHEMIYLFAEKIPEYDITTHNCLGVGMKKVGPSPLYGKVKMTTPKRNYEPPLPKSVIKFQNQQRGGPKGHPTRKPVDLMKFLLTYWSKEGDVVLDPTAGGGSMGVACKEMKREFIGIELDEKYFELMKNNIDK